MPTPVAHCLAGTAIQFLSRGPHLRGHWRSLLLLVTLSNLPDVDFIPGYFVGDPRAYHWGPTHSLLAGVLVGGVLFMLTGARSGRYGTMIALSSLAYLCHILLDML